MPRKIIHKTSKRKTSDVTVKLTTTTSMTITGTPKRVAETVRYISRPYFVDRDGIVIFDKSKAIEHNINCSDKRQR